ncbi:hypothetical protein [Pseudoalteromonas gelatinilytica]
MRLWSVLVLITTLSGCGGGSGGDDIDKEPPIAEEIVYSEGIFISENLSGVQYTVNYPNKQEASVTKNGVFKFLDGAESIEFGVGSISLGSATPTSFVTTLELNNALKSISEPESINKLIFLYNLDEDLNSINGINIPQSSADAFKNATLDFESDTFSDDFETLLATQLGVETESLAKGASVGYFLGEIAASNPEYCPYTIDFEALFRSPARNCQEVLERNIVAEVILPTLSKAATAQNKVNLGVADRAVISRELISIFQDSKVIAGFSSYIKNPNAPLTNLQRIGMIEETIKTSTGFIAGAYSKMTTGEEEFGEIINNALFNIIDANICFADKRACFDFWISITD